jgi:hypothetical protein
MPIKNQQIGTSRIARTGLAESKMSPNNNGGAADPIPINPKPQGPKEIPIAASTVEINEERIPYMKMRIRSSLSISITPRKSLI